MGDEDVLEPGACAVEDSYVRVVVILKTSVDTIGRLYLCTSRCFVGISFRSVQSWRSTYALNIRPANTRCRIFPKN